MATSYYDRLNYAFEKFAELALPSSAQLVYLHILHEDNCFGRTGQVSIADRSLLVKTGLSKSTLTDAKRRLKSCGLLDFKPNVKDPHNGTPYTLPNIEGRAVGRAVGRADNNNINTTPIPSKERERTTANSAHASKAAISTNSAEVRQAWFDCEGSELKGGVALGLIELEKEHGAQALIAAIHEAHRANTRLNLSFNFVKAVLERMQKGEQTNDRKPSESRMDAWDARQDELPPE